MKIILLVLAISVIFAYISPGMEKIKAPATKTPDGMDTVYYPVPEIEIYPSAGKNGVACFQSVPAPYPAPVDMPEFNVMDLLNTVRYPDLALKNGISAHLVMEILLGKDGRIRKWRTLSSEIRRNTVEKVAWPDSFFADTFIRALTRITFRPAILNAREQRPLFCWMRFDLHFIACAGDIPPRARTRPLNTVSP